MEGIHGYAVGKGVGKVARPQEEIEELRGILKDLRSPIVHRALLAWRRSPETFSEEISALKDVDEALNNARAT